MYLHKFCAVLASKMRSSFAFFLNCCILSSVSSLTSFFTAGTKNKQKNQKQHFMNYYFDMVLNQKCDTDCIKVRIKLYSKKSIFKISHKKVKYRIYINKNANPFMHVKT